MSEIFVSFIKKIVATTHREAHTHWRTELQIQCACSKLSQITSDGSPCIQPPLASKKSIFLRLGAAVHRLPCMLYKIWEETDRGPGNSKIVDEQYLEIAAFLRVYQEFQSFQIFLRDHTARILKIKILRGLRHPFILSTVTVCHISLQLFCGLLSFE